MRPTGPQPKPSSRRGWRGAQTEVRPPARYNWQRDAADSEAAASARPARRLRWRLAAYALVGTLLLAAFIYSLLFVPPKTPFVLVAPSLAAPYEAPLPPDAWIAEDAARFLQLDDAGAGSAGILRVHDSSRDWHSVSQGLEGLRRQLRELAKANDHSHAVIIYVSMHGAVDDAGNPCFILPSSPGLSELQTSSWVRVSELLEAISAAGFRENIVKLLVIDSSRFRVNWGLGTIYNTFTDRLRSIVESADVPNLAVLNSVSPGELGWSSLELQGSVFAHFLQRGLSGDADDRASGGNHDRKVSLSELNRYVTRQVQDWVWRNRGEHQHPLLIAARNVPQEGTISWALRPAERKSVQQQSPGPPAPGVASDRDDFWRQYARLNERGAATVDPLAWARLQRSILRFEQCLGAGRAYAAAARDARAATAGLLRDFDRLAAGGHSGSLVGAQRHDLDALRLFASPSMPMAAAFGSAPDGELQSVASALEALADAPDGDALNETLSHLESIPSAPRLAEVHFLRLLRQYRTADRLLQPDVIPKAVAARQWAELAAAPADERLLSRSRGAVTEIDADRRALEDQLFAGLPFSSADWEAVRGRYQQQAEIAGQFAADLRWRDQVLAELPWLAQWLTRVSLQTGHGEQEQLDGEIADSLRNLIRSVCRTTADQFLAQSATSELRRDFHALRSRIDDQYERLLNTKQPDGKDVRDAVVLLDLPLLPQRVSAGDVRSPVDARAALRTLAAQWASQLAAGAGDEAAEPPPAETDADRGARFLARIESSWRYHPAIEIFADSQQPADAPAASDLTLRLIARETLLRQMLATLPDRLKAIRGAALADTNLDAARAGWSDGERISRALAALNVATLDVDPPLELRQRDLEQWLIWHAGRALDDFYGSADPQQSPFFVQAARDALAAAAELAGDCAAVRKQIATVDGVLQQRQSLAAAGPSHKLLMTRVSDVVIIDEHIPAYTTVSLGPHARQNAVTLPPGLASLYVDAVPGEPATLPTVTMPLAQPAQHAVPILESLIQSLPPGTAGNHAAILSFRGHQFASPFEIAHLEGAESRYTPSQADSADILVIGPQQRAPDVMLVLDCSASMQRPLDLEAGQLRRFDAALLALRPMLEGLARQGDMRIGVTLFGHRARWDHDRLGEVLRQPSYGRPISPNQMPYDDVETVLPIGRFDPTIAGQLFDTLRTAAPWGESPLFLALIEALRQFPSAQNTASQSIILVTDGLNSQFNAPRDKRRYLPDVLQALAGRSIPIHVVGFGIDQAEAGEAQQAYQQLADSSQGSYAPIEEATELVEYLRGLVTRESFTVQDGGRFSATATVGSQQRVNSLATRVQPLTVSSTSAAINVTAEGGESLRLLLSPDGTQLTVEPYLAGNPRFFPLSGDAGAHGLKPNLVVHQPLRKQGDVEFEVSLQDRDGRFVPRPRSVWIEIIPVLADGSRGNSYTFYDRNFQSDVGVPDLRCRATNWPAAKQAEVHFFCRFDELEPDQVVPVNPDQLSGASHAVPLPGPASGSLTIEHLGSHAPELRIVEEYESSMPEFPAFRVDLAGVEGLVEVVRRFDARHQVCVHRFRLADTDPAQLAAAVLRVTRRDRERIGAWQLSSPVRVDIAPADGLIVLPPP